MTTSEDLLRVMAASSEGVLAGELLAPPPGAELALLRDRLALLERRVDQALLELRTLREQLDARLEAIEDRLPVRVR